MRTCEHGYWLRDSPLDSAGENWVEADARKRGCRLVPDPTLNKLSRFTKIVSV